MRRVLIALTMLAAAGMLAAVCRGNNSGSGRSGSAGASATTAAPSCTRGGRAYGGYGGGPTSSAAGTTTSGTAVTIDNFGDTRDDRGFVAVRP